MTPRFLIIESDPIVSLDLVEIIKENIIDPVVNVAQSLEDAASHMDEYLSPTVALIDAPAERFEHSELFRKMFSSGTKMIFLDMSLNELAQTDRNFVLVAQPFSTTMIVHALSALGVPALTTAPAPPEPTDPAS